MSEWERKRLLVWTMDTSLLLIDDSVPVSHAFSSSTPTFKSGQSRMLNEKVEGLFDFQTFFFIWR